MFANATPLPAAITASLSPDPIEDKDLARLERRAKKEAKARRRKAWQIAFLAESYAHHRLETARASRMIAYWGGRAPKAPKENEDSLHRAYVDASLRLVRTRAPDKAAIGVKRRKMSFLIANAKITEAVFDAIIKQDLEAL